MNHYETVFILNPVLSETQIEEAVQKFEKFLTTRKGTITSKENWGLKKARLSYSKQKKCLLPPDGVYCFWRSN